MLTESYKKRLLELAGIVSESSINNINESLLQESLFDIDSDVNLLYDKYFKDDIDVITATGVVNSNMFEKHKLDTSILESSFGKEAHIKNPCEIWINYASNFYSPLRRVISLSVNQKALEFLKDVNIGTGDVGVYKLDLASNTLNGTQRKRFENEFTEHKIKGSINHELIHWLDETLHNKSISKLLSKASEVGMDTYLKGKDVNTTKVEIQGQMGNIKQLKNKYLENWDYLTFQDLMNMSVTLGIVYENLEGKDRDEWVRDLKTRMHREGLLGKNMVN